MDAGISVFNGLSLTNSELDYGIALWLTVILDDIFRYRLLFLFCISSYTYVYHIHNTQSTY